MKPVNRKEMMQRITDWINDAQDGWTEEEARFVRTKRKQATIFLRYSSMSLADIYYAFELVKDSQ